jgi:hypothetical protein
MLLEHKAEYSDLGDCKHWLYTNKFFVFSDNTSSGVTEIRQGPQKL